jgi:hypothetical protein
MVQMRNKLLISGFVLTTILQGCLYQDPSSNSPVAGEGQTIYNKSLAKTVDPEWVDTIINPIPMKIKNVNEIIELKTGVSESGARAFSQRYKKLDVAGTTLEFRIRKKYERPRAPGLQKTYEGLRADLFSKTSVRLGHRAQVHSTITFARENFLYSYDNEVWGDIYAATVEDWVTGDDNMRTVFHGNVYEGDALTQGQIPRISIEPQGAENFTVPHDATLYLDGGKYGVMTMRDRATVYVYAEIYEFEKIVMQTDTKIINATGMNGILGSVQGIYVGQRAKIYSEGLGSHHYLMTGGSVTLDNDSEVDATLWSYGGEVVLKDRAKLYGNTEVVYLELFNDAKIYSNAHLDREDLELLY